MLNRRYHNFDSKTIQSLKGFTLIEVMVSIFITSVLVLGLTSIWSVVTSHFLDAQLRHRAVIGTNSEMERLVALYNHGLSVDTETATYDQML